MNSPPIILSRPHRPQHSPTRHPIRKLSRMRHNPRTHSQSRIRRQPIKTNPNINNLLPPHPLQPKRPPPPPPPPNNPPPPPGTTDTPASACTSGRARSRPAESNTTGLGTTNAATPEASSKRIAPPSSTRGTNPRDTTPHDHSTPPNTPATFPTPKKSTTLTPPATTTPPDQMPPVLSLPQKTHPPPPQSHQTQDLYPETPPGTAPCCPGPQAPPPPAHERPPAH